MHRKLIKDKNELINFDINARNRRKWMRQWHKNMRANGRKCNSEQEQLNFSSAMLSNSYDLCKNINKCHLCSSVDGN